MGNLHPFTLSKRAETPDPAGLTAASITARPPLQLLLAGSGEVRAEGIVAAVRRDGAPQDRIVMASTFREALSAVQSDAGLTAVLVDLGLPGLSGIHGVERLIAVRPGLPVVILYERCGREQCVALWRAGIAGMFPRSLGGRALIAALEEVSNGRPCALLIPPQPAATAIAAPPPHAAPPAFRQDDHREPNPTVALSPRERQVAALIAKGQSNKEIARRLDLQEPTVKVYVGALFRKLAVRNRTEAATRLLALNLA